VRQTVLRLIGSHLRDDVPVSWQRCDLEFTRAVLDGADWRRARFTGGDIIFISTDEVEFAEGSSVYSG